ncbi:ketoacyl-ACP synthase III family protein [Nocardia sp. NPDC046473]|uniref:ketoacyl-ACP synthase III family protein n=1 Tax=Nocardia sp. NPDC046473 TaxID=3155733 RepID=UPI0033CCEDD4
MGIDAVCVSQVSGPEMAAAAAIDAMAHAGTRPEQIDLVLHASTYFQGHDLWAPASFVRRVSVGQAGLSVDVGQLSNGGMAALELATSYLHADPRRHSALVTTGDRFCAPGFDRWNTDPGTVCGDGGTGLVLSAYDGFARLLALVTISDPELEAMGRGEDPFARAALAARRPISLQAHRAGLIQEYGLGALLQRLQTGQRKAFDDALSQACVRLGDVAWFVVPNLGRPKMDQQFFRPLGISPERTTWERGRRTGHLGAGDQIAGLAHLVNTGVLTTGSICVLIGAGGGFAWSTAVLEIMRPPQRTP